MMYYDLTLLINHQSTLYGHHCSTIWIMEHRSYKNESFFCLLPENPPNPKIPI